MKKREDRRARTHRKGTARQREHLQRIHPSGVIDCVCEQSIWRFAKRKGLGCEKCRRRTHGNPKVPCGLCTRGDSKWRPAVVERIAGKRLVRRWLTARRLRDVDA